jgi:hypothetical protein
VAGGVQDGLQEIGGAGLAVGAGDAHQGQLWVDRKAALAGQGQPGLGHLDHRDPGRHGGLLFGDDDPGALLEAGCQKKVAVGALALEGHEEPAGDHLPGMISHPGDRQTVIPPHFNALKAAEQLSQSL